MGILSFFKGKKEETTQHRFDDDDRKLSADMRKFNSEMKRQQAQLEMEAQKLEFERRKLQMQLDMERIKAEIDDLVGVDDDTPDSTGNSADTMLQTLLMSVMMKQQGVNIPTSAPPVNTPQDTLQNPQSNSNQVQKLSLSDDELKEIWNRDVPDKYKKLSKTLSDTAIMAFIKQNLPAYDDDTHARALKIARGN